MNYRIADESGQGLRGAAGQFGYGLVIAIKDLERAKSLLAGLFAVEEFPHSMNISSRESGLRVRIRDIWIFRSVRARANY